MVAFLGVLVTTRLDEIAHFASLGSDGAYVALFVLYQIPYVLPIALPISALISSILLVQGLSNSQELTAMRASGLALKDIFTPIILAAAILSAVSFYVVSELATTSHLKTSLLKNEIRSVNPLLMLANKHLMKIKGIYYDPLGPSRLGESASHVIIAMPNKRNGRLNLMVAEKMLASPTHFTAANLSLITSLPSEEAIDAPDTIAVENIKKTSLTADDFSQMIQKKVWNINNDYLNLSLLLVRVKEQSLALQQAKDSGAPLEKRAQMEKSQHRNISEIVRRFSLSLAVLTFTFMGISFGISIRRLPSQRGLICVVALTTFFLAAYFFATGLGHNLLAATPLYLAPHVIIVGASIWFLLRTSRGIE